jgi:hypothetical protein
MKKLSLQQIANIAKVVVISAWIVLMTYLLNSCGSACSRTHKYWSNHRCV